MAHFTLVGTVAIWATYFFTVARSQIPGPGPVLISNPIPFDGNNPLIQGGPFQLNVRLTYRAATEVVGPVCNRHITIPASEYTVDAMKSPEVPAAQVRVQPQVEIVGPKTAGAYYTLVLAGQPEDSSDFATPTKPIVHWIQSDIEGPSGALTVAPFLPFMPMMVRGGIALVLLYRQPNAAPNDISVAEFVDNKCELGSGRCMFDVEKFATDFSLTLDFAGYFTVLTDQYSTALSATLPFVRNGCFFLDKFDLEANPLIGTKARDFQLGVMARFSTPSETLGPVCGLVFSYKEETIEITAGTGKPVPSRTTRSIPWVWYHRMDDDESWKEEWFTLAYVSQVTNWPAAGSPEKPLLLWLVTNIKGGDISNGLCDVPYHPTMPMPGDQEVMFILYRQLEKVEINPADYSESECQLQYRCSFNLEKMAEENKLMMVGAQNFWVSADPHSVITNFKANHSTEMEACGDLIPFKHEGKMLGQCLPKFTSWQELKERVDQTEDKDERTKLIEQMREMCPEMAEEHKVDKSGENDEKKDEAEEMEKMKEWMMKEMTKRHHEMQKKKEMEEKKNFMQMLMEKMLGEKTEDKTKNTAEMEKKDCGEEMMEMMLKMKNGMDMKGDNWDDQERQLGPCMMAVVTHLKEQHDKYVAKKEMTERFGNFMQERMTQFLRHMVMNKMAEHLGLVKCDEDGAGEKPCADPEKMRMLLWKRYVMMKGEKQDAVKKMEKKSDNKMDYLKKQMKELMFLKSVLSMMEEQKGTLGQSNDPMPALKDFVKSDPNWKRFCDDL